MKTKCLFGGALLGAGLCAGASSSALAGEFQFGNSTFNANINFNSTSTSMNGNGISTIIDTNTGTSAYATASFSDSSLSLFLQSASYANSIGIAYGSINTSFTVSQDVTVRLDPGATFSSVNFLYFDTSAGNPNSPYAYPMGTREYGSTNFPSDTLDVYLTANTTYFLRVYGRAWTTSQTRISGEAFSMTIVSAVPLPPGAFAGLGMLAGLGAYKRIRRR